MKKYHRYRMDFESNWLRWSATFVGIAMFLRVIRYIGIEYLEDPRALVWDLWVPVGVGLLYTVLLRGFRFNAPGIYAIIGILMCFSLLSGVFAAENALRTVLGLFGYIFCCAILVICTGGLLPGRLPAAVCFGALFGCRILLFDLGRISGLDWMTTLADWGFLLALVCLPMGMVPGKMRK